MDFEEWKASKMPPLKTADATVRDGRVVLRYGNEEARLTPASARTWARTVLLLADVAELEGAR